MLALPTAAAPFVPAILLAPDNWKDAQNASPYKPHRTGEAQPALETALLAAKELCQQHPGSVPVLFVAKTSAVAGRTTTNGHPLRPLPTDQTGTDGKPLLMCVVN